MTPKLAALQREKTESIIRKQQKQDKQQEVEAKRRRRAGTDISERERAVSGEALSRKKMRG